VTLLRILWAGFSMNIRQVARSSLFVFTSIIEPLIMASIAFYTAKAGGKDDALLYFAIGAGIMGMWSTTLFASGGVISWQRWQGTLELLVGSPPSMLPIVAPQTFANACVGLYSMTATLVFGRVLFHIPLHLAHPVLFVLAVPTAVVAMGLLGLVIGASFVLYREANALSNMLEFPIALVTGILFSTSVLPDWTRPIGWILAPTWAVRVVRDTALGGNPLLPFVMCFVLGAAYVVLATWLLGVVERAARERATLSLA
jgi:ABC-2 type transport system permease protein